MKKLLKLPVLLSILIVSGCATTMESDDVKNKSNMVAKKTVDQSVLETVEEINSQLTLLENLSRGIEVPKPPVVVHNQNLHEDYVVKQAPKKITPPQVVVHNHDSHENYAVNPVPKKVTHPQMVVVKETTATTTTTTTSVPVVAVKPVATVSDSNIFVIPSEFNKKAKIQWHNKSLNTIVGGIASAVKYDFVVIPSKTLRDQNINFNVNDETLIVVLKNIATVVDSFANIELSHKDKVIKVVYK